MVYFHSTSGTNVYTRRPALHHLFVHSWFPISWGGHHRFSRASEQRFIQKSSKKTPKYNVFLKTDRLYIRDYLSEIMYSYDTQSDAPDWMTVLICRDRGASKIPFFYLQLNKKPGIVLSSNRRSSCLLIPLRGDGEVRVLLQVTMTITHQPLSGDAYVSAGEKQAWQSRRLYLLVSISRSDYMCLSQKDNFLRCMLERWKTWNYEKKIWYKCAAHK